MKLFWLFEARYPLLGSFRDYDSKMKYAEDEWPWEGKIFPEGPYAIHYTSLRGLKGIIKHGLFPMREKASLKWEPAGADNPIHPKGWYFTNIKPVLKKGALSRAIFRTPSKHSAAGYWVVIDIAELDPTGAIFRDDPGVPHSFYIPLYADPNSLWSERGELTTKAQKSRVTTGYPLKIKIVGMGAVTEDAENALREDPEIRSLLNDIARGDGFVTPGEEYQEPTENDLTWERVKIQAQREPIDRPTVRSVVIRNAHTPDPQILVLNNTGASGMSAGHKRERWTFPGGGVDAGESETEAAIRETLEETGISATPVPSVDPIPLTGNIFSHTPSEDPQLYELARQRLLDVAQNLNVSPELIEAYSNEIYDSAFRFREVGHAYLMVSTDATQEPGKGGEEGVPAYGTTSNVSQRIGDRRSPAHVQTVSLMRELLTPENLEKATQWKRQEEEEDWEREQRRKEAERLETQAKKKEKTFKKTMAGLKGSKGMSLSALKDLYAQSRSDVEQDPTSENLLSRLDVLFERL